MKAWIVRQKNNSLEVWGGNEKPTIIDSHIGWWGEELFAVLSQDNSLGDGLAYKNNPREVVIEIMTKEERSNAGSKTAKKVNDIMAEMVKLRHQVALLKINCSCSRCLEPLGAGLCVSCVEKIEAKLNPYWLWDDFKKVFVEQNGEANHENTI